MHNMFISISISNLYLIYIYHQARDAGEYQCQAATTTGTRTLVTR